MDGPGTATSDVKSSSARSDPQNSVALVVHRLEERRDCSAEMGVLVAESQFQVLANLVDLSATRADEHAGFAGFGHGLDEAVDRLGLADTRRAVVRPPAELPSHEPATAGSEPDGRRSVVRRLSENVPDSALCHPARHWPSRTAARGKSLNGVRVAAPQLGCSVGADDLSQRGETSLPDLRNAFSDVSRKAFAVENEESGPGANDDAPGLSESARFERAGVK